MVQVSTLFFDDVSRPIEEVIKVDQADQTVLRDEFREYVVTDSIRSQLIELLRRYDNAPRQPSDSIGVWVSGFFGSGKSSFAKLAGTALANRPVLDDRAADLLAAQARSPEVTVLLKQITERIPTEAVIFDVSTDRAVRGGDQALTEIVYRLFLQQLGYARDLDLAELEITLEGDGRLDAFRSAYQQHFHKDWDTAKARVAFALNEASKVMHALEPTTYNAPDSWAKAATRRADITPNLLAERCKLLMDRRRPGLSLVFVVDEVGQYVARDVQKMLDLQGIVQALGRVGRGRFWLVVTSQEKLNELVAGLDDRRIELNRLMDRFPLQVHLEPADISVVTSRRVLSKNAGAQASLRQLYDGHRGRLVDATRLSADIELPQLDATKFIDLYPLLPYQVDLVIQVVSGLRSQAGASRHVGGANRTIIKLAQQLLIHPQTNLAAQEVGVLARIDQVYDLVAGNIASEVRGKIDAIPGQATHRDAQAVCKAICLLQYVKSIHRTAENIAATLHAAVDADSRLADVKAALDELIRRRLLKLTDNEYRIPTPAEDDWERQRDALQPRQGDVHRIHSEALVALWSPVPAHALLDVRTFKAGLYFNGRMQVEGDVPVHVTLEKPGPAFADRDEEARRRSQAERGALMWVGAIDDAVALATEEVFRSQQILSAKERTATTATEGALVAEERLRKTRHEADLKRLLKQALLSGHIWFRGNDRSPDGGQPEVAKAAAHALGRALPEVYERFGESAAKVAKKDLDTLLTTENLRGLTPLFVQLKLVREQDGQVVFETDQGPLAEVFHKIKNRTSYGETATGRWLADELNREPFGWDFDVVRLLVIALLRAGKIEATSQAQPIDSATSLAARTAFPDNTRFRSASFRPKEGLDPMVLVEACHNYQQAFGREIPEIEENVVVRAIRTEVGNAEPELRRVEGLLDRHGLPGAPVLAAALERVAEIMRGRSADTVHVFNTAWRELKEALRRSHELSERLTDAALVDLQHARQVVAAKLPVLSAEPDLDPALAARGAALADILQRETFFRELGTLDDHARKLAAEHDRRFTQAVEVRQAAYVAASQALAATPGWGQLTGAQQLEVSAPLTRCLAPPAPGTPIPQLRADADACDGRLAAARRRVAELVDGRRLVRVRVSSFFEGGIDDADVLVGAIQRLREHCEELIRDGKKVHLE
jgi:hypothetical protein